MKWIVCLFRGHNWLMNSHGDYKKCTHCQADRWLVLVTWRAVPGMGWQPGTNPQPIYKWMNTRMPMGPKKGGINMGYPGPRPNIAPAPQYPEGRPPTGRSAVMPPDRRK